MAEEAHTAEAAEMAGMPPMLAYTFRGNLQPGHWPYIRIGQGQSSQTLSPNRPIDDSYWIVILDANKPATNGSIVLVPEELWAGSAGQHPLHPVVRLAPIVE